MFCPLVNSNLKAQIFTYTHPPFILKSLYTHNPVYKIKIFWYILKDNQNYQASTGGWLPSSVYFEGLTAA